MLYPLAQEGDRPKDLFVVFVFKSSETEPHSSSDGHGTHYIIVQAGLNSQVSFHPSFPSARILCLNHHTQLFPESNLVWETLELKLEMLTQASSLF